MRTKAIRVKDKEYLACFSTRVLVALEEKYGDADVGLSTVLSGGKVNDLFWLLAQLLEAGDRYAKQEGIENPGALSLDDLLDRVGVDEYKDMFAGVAEAIREGSGTTVDIEPEKNVEARQVAG